MNCAATPSCEIVTVCPATVMVPIRMAWVEFCWSEYVTVPLPLPLAPAFIADVVPLEIPVSATQVAPVPEYEAR